MEEIKHRYVWKRLSDGHIWMEIVPIECLENNGDTPFILRDHSLFELISRDVYTGLKDKNSDEIYEADEITWKCSGSIITGIVYWASSGWFVKDKRGGNVTRLHKASTIKITGTIYDNLQSKEEQEKMFQAFCTSSGAGN